MSDLRNSLAPTDPGTAALLQPFGPPGAFGQAVSSDIGTMAQNYWAWRNANAARAFDPSNVGMGFAFPGAGTIRAFHGTAVPFGKFADEFIGSGEGAQTYGWGHYVAGNLGVAEEYMPEPELDLRFQGQPWLHDPWLTGGVDDPKNVAHEYLSQSGEGEGIDDALNRIRADADYFQGKSGAPHPQQGMSVLPYSQQSDVLNRGADWLDANRNHIDMSSNKGSHLLEINIKPDEHELLDLDRTYGQQTPEIKQNLRNLWGKMYGIDPDKVMTPEEFSNVSGRSIQNSISNHVGSHLFNSPAIRATGFDPGVSFTPMDHLINDVLSKRPLSGLGKVNDEITSKLLDSVGIPGNKYLDQGSRANPFKLQYTGDEKLPDVFSDFNLNNVESVPALQAQLFNRQRSLASMAGPNSPALSKYDDALRFVFNNAGKFEQVDKPGLTRNYVIFHPDNLEIKTRDGIPLTPVDHNPFGGM